PGAAGRAAAGTGPCIGGAGAPGDLRTLPPGRGAGSQGPGLTRRNANGRLSRPLALMSVAILVGYCLYSCPSGSGSRVMSGTFWVAHPSPDLLKRLVGRAGWR